MADNIKNMTPKQIVAELDKYIIGQDEAKKYVAIALRNRYRRSLLSEEMKEEISPKNILMMGPTGVGKTEIARRLAKLMDAPFVKVEATKFTEVGYVGRDVDSMIRDLVEASMRLSKQKRMDENAEMADVIAEDIIVKSIVPSPKSENNGGVQLGNIFGNLGYKSQRQEYEENKQKEYEQSKEYSDIKMARDQVREQLRQGLLEDQIVEIEVDDVPKTNQLDQNENMIAIGNIFPSEWNWQSFWSLTALLSVILAIMNILPIPGLDGGHALFTLWEIITRRKPSDKFLEVMQYIGLGLLLLLLVYANGSDIVKLFIK